MENCNQKYQKYQKSDLINIFREIGTLEPDHFKGVAYSRGADSLSKLSDEEFSERKTFLDLRGIGSSLNSKILHFKETGTVPKLFGLREYQKNFLDQNLYKVRKGFITKRIPVSQVESEILPIMIESLGSYYHIGRFLGSLRRNWDNKNALVADVDYLVENTFYSEIVNMLAKSDRLTIVVSGDSKTTFVVDNIEKTTIDVTSVKKEHMAFSILHFTGSARFNIKMRAHAKSMGYSLNQYGLTVINMEGESKADQDIRRMNVLTYDFSEESDIFTFLNYPYVEPKNR